MKEAIVQAPRVAERQGNLKPQIPKRRADLYQQFASVYYLLQYTIMHILIFGFEVRAMYLIPKIATAFHWEEILSALWNFRNVFIDGFAAQSVLVLFILAIPYTVMLALAAWRVLLYLFVLYQLIWFCIIKLRQIAYERRISLTNIVVGKIGAPGNGKSSSGLHEAVIMARKMWEKLRLQYFCYSAQVKKWRADPDRYSQKLIEWNEIKFSYKYFTTPQKCKVIINGKEVERTLIPCPCLMTNIPVEVNGKMTSYVGPEHLEQKKRLPAHVVLFLDEIGAMLDVDKSKERMGDGLTAQIAVLIADLFRLIRHFLDARAVYTEQDASNVFIDVRRVVSKNQRMLEQKWVLKPYLFLLVRWPINKLCLFLTKENEEGKRVINKALAPPLMFFNKLISYIGFRRYLHTTQDGTNAGDKGVAKGKRAFYLNSRLNFKYDERTFRNFYLAKDQVCEPLLHKSLILDFIDPYKNMFSRAERKMHKEQEKEKKKNEKKAA